MVGVVIPAATRLAVCLLGLWVVTAALAGFGAIQQAGTDGYQVSSQSVSSDDLDDSLIELLDLGSGPNVAILRVTVSSNQRGADSESQRADVRASVRSEDGTRQVIDLREADAGGAVVYLGSYRVTGMLQTFDVIAQPLVEDDTVATPVLHLNYRQAAP